MAARTTGLGTASMELLRSTAPAAPEPAGYGQSAVRPGKAFYHPQMKEFLLMYDDIRLEPSPRSVLLEFLQSAYEAAASLAKWNRLELERT